MATTSYGEGIYAGGGGGRTVPYPLGRISGGSAAYAPLSQSDHKPLLIGMIVTFVVLTLLRPFCILRRSKEQDGGGGGSG